MCAPAMSLRFCTCSEEPPPGVPAWCLARKSKVQDELIVGTLLVPEEPSQQDELTIEAVLARLHAPAPFDFDYTPAEGDRLEVILSTGVHILVFGSSEEDEDGDRTARNQEASAHRWSYSRYGTGFDSYDTLAEGRIEVVF